MNYLKAILLAFATLLLPIKTLILTVGLLVFIDLVTGLVAAKKQNIPITSSGFRRTVVKMFVYESAIIAAYFLGKYIVDADTFVAKIIAGAIGVTGMKSILENAEIVTGHNLAKRVLELFWSESDKK